MIVRRAPNAVNLEEHPFVYWLENVNRRIPIHVKATVVVRRTPVAFAIIFVTSWGIVAPTMMTYVVRKAAKKVARDYVSQMPTVPKAGFVVILAALAWGSVRQKMHAWTILKHGLVKVIVGARHRRVVVVVMPAWLQATAVMTIKTNVILLTPSAIKRVIQRC